MASIPPELRLKVQATQMAAYNWVEHGIQATLSSYQVLLIYLYPEIFCFGGICCIRVYVFYNHI